MGRDKENNNIMDNRTLVNVNLFLKIVECINEAKSLLQKGQIVFHLYAVMINPSMDTEILYNRVAV